jgi:hypothetical protein
MRAGSDDAGFHVTDVRLVNQNQVLQNDSNISPADLAGGVRIECDEEVDLRSVRGKPTAFITLDMPFPFNSLDRDLWGGDVVGFQPLMLAANVNADNNSIFWQPTPETSRWLSERLLNMMREFKRGERVLAHLTLKGNFIWSAKDPQRFLDGTAFGTVDDNRSETRIRFPSGDGRAGGDFELWFWLNMERIRRQVNVGIIPHRVQADPRAQQAFSLAIDRSKLRTALPAEYQAADAPFDPAQARKLLRELSGTQIVLNALIVEDFAVLGRTVLGMLQENLNGNGMTVRIQMDTVPRNRLEETVRLMLGIVGRRPLSMVFGDESDAERLASLFRNDFDGTLIAI